jgi:F-type H+-transporting ATPase subunit a
MGLEFLNRVRRTALIAGAVLALPMTSYRGLPAGLGFAAGLVWSLINLRLIEALVVTLTGRERGTGAAYRAAAWTLGGMGLLMAAGGWLLVKLPIPSLLGGFLLPFGVIVLKAGSTLLIQSRVWRAMVASPWRAAAVVAVVLVAAWWVVPGRLNATGAPKPGTAHFAGKTIQLENGSGAQPKAPAPEAGATRQAADHAGAESGHTEGQEEESGPQKFANVITVLHRAFPKASWSHFLHQNEAVIFALLVAFLLSITAFAASRNPQLIPGNLQNLFEVMVEGLYDFIASIIGEKNAPRFVPFLGTLGVYIWCMNLFGLLPFMDSPTSSLNVTFALGLVVFLYVQWIGLRGLGIVGYLDHMLGQPRDVTGWLLAPLMLPIHVLGELAKPISLSCRLFGNIFGEDMLLVAFVSLGITSLSFLHLPLGLPLQLPFLFLALLTSTLQAAVFMVLSTIYILLMLPHDDHAHDHNHADVPASEVQPHSIG